MVEFPPPSSGGGAAGVEPAYPSAPERPGFVFPPPRQSSGSVRDAGRYVGEKLRDVTDTADWAAETSRNQGEVIDSYGEALSTKVGPEAVPTIAPLSQTINRRADPTFQLSDFMAPKMYGTDSRGDTVTVSPSGLSAGASTSGVVYYAFITPLINRAYEQLNFMVSEVSGTPRQMDVGVYTLDPVTKQLTRQVYEPNVGAGLPFTESVVTVTFDRWVAEQGSYVCIAWYQSGTGEARQLLGLEESKRPLTNMVFPPKISARSTVGTGGLDSVIDGGSASRVNFSGYWFTPYAELSEAISVILRFFQDPFTADTNQNIARPWVTLTSNLIRISNEGWAGVPNYLVIQLGAYCAVYDTPMSTDRVQISARALERNYETTAFSFIALRTTNNMNAGVGVFYNATTIQIRTWSGTDAEGIRSSATVRASASWTLGTSREFTAQWLDGVITVYDELGTAIISWADTVTLPEPRYRFTGIGFERISGASSPRLDHWVARDLPDDEEEEEAPE